MPRRPRPVLAAVVGAAVVAACAGCGGDEPTVAEWTAIWERERATVPSADDLLDGGRELCDDLNGRYRERLPELESPPIEVIEDTVRDWTEEVESLVFDCPNDRTQIDERLARIDVLTAEIDAALTQT